MVLDQVVFLEEVDCEEVVLDDYPPKDRLLRQVSGPSLRE